MRTFTLNFAFTSTQVHFSFILCFLSIAGSSFLFRVRLFWVKMISGNHFHPFPHVWLQRKIQFSGNCIPADQNLRLWLGNEFTLSFSLQFISGKREREREKREPRSEREWEKRELRSESTDRRSRCSSEDRTAPMSGAIDERDRWDRAMRSMRSHRSSARVLVWWDRIARHRSSSGRSHRSDLSSLFSHDRWFIFFCWVLVSFAWFDSFSFAGFWFRWWFFSGLWLVFWICVFLLLFQTPENIFRKIFWNTTKHHGNIFLFRKLAFPENMYFPENVLQQPNTA